MGQLTDGRDQSAKHPPEVYDEVLFRRKMVGWAIYIKLAVHSLMQVRGDVTLVDDDAEIMSLFSLCSKPDVNSLEQRLGNEDFKKKVIIHLARFGGRNIHDAINVLSHKCIADGLAVEYSYYGRGENRAPFNSTILHQIMFSAVRANSKSSSATENDMKLVVSKFLNRAAERLTEKQATAKERNTNPGKENAEKE